MWAEPKEERIMKTLCENIGRSAAERSRIERVHSAQCVRFKLAEPTVDQTKLTVPVLQPEGRCTDHRAIGFSVSPSSLRSVVARTADPLSFSAV